MQVGTLADSQILERCKKGELVSEGFIEKNVKQAAYELSLGDVYFDLTEGGMRISTGDSGNALIKPGHMVVLMTREKLKIPRNIIGRLVSKGSLFSCGLMPVSTFADPGFTGNIGIVTHNLSNHYVLLPVNEPIAKIEFSVLMEDVNSGYSGQHGFGTEIWPIKDQFLKTYEQVRHDPRVGDELNESLSIYPSVIAKSFNVVFNYQHKIVWIFFALALLNVIILGIYWGDSLANVAALIISITANIITTILVYIATKTRD